MVAVVGNIAGELLPGTAGRHRNIEMIDLDPMDRRLKGKSRPMAKRHVSRDVAGVAKEPGKPVATLYDDIEAAWLQQRPDLDMAMACTLLRLERVNQLHEMRVQAISRAVGLHTGDLHVLLALRRSGKPYELRPTDLFRALLVTSGAMTKRVARLQEGGFILRVSANDDGRSELVRLTAKGLATADRGITQIARGVERVTEESGLTRAEIAALDRALRKLLTVRKVKSATGKKPA
jgi:DNA-binding MarR family transcriptional regulator